MPQVVSSDRSVVEAVARALTFDAFQVIAIGGNTLAGKTTLARKLAKALNISCFHLDDFINANPGIDLPRVKQVMFLALILIPFRLAERFIWKFKIQRAYLGPTTFSGPTGQSVLHLMVGQICVNLCNLQMSDSRSPQ